MDALCAGRGDPSYDQLDMLSGYLVDAAGTGASVSLYHCLEGQAEKKGKAGM